MTGEFVPQFVLLMLSASLGINIVFWFGVGAVRFVSELVAGRPTDRAAQLTREDVAAVIPAHNEETALPRCIEALLAVLPARQIYVASDGSRDGTVAIAASYGCHVLDIQPNGGKARAIDRAVRHFELCERYQVVLIQDADSEIDPLYLRNGLPLFNDRDVAAVAGHVLSRWRPQRWPTPDMLYTAYRTRLYRLLQMAFQYGLSWKPFSLSYIAPGFASMYRTSALRQIDITAPGLVIEDFNMTFEVQHRHLGRIAYSPQVRCSSEDPFRLADYSRQVQRWYLGFWQTVRRHGVWPSAFWAALGGLLMELVFISLFTLALPVMLLAWAIGGLNVPAFSLLDLHLHSVSPPELVALFFAVDYLLTVAVAMAERRPSLLVYGFAFPVLRFLDAALFLKALAGSFSAVSDGRWQSPQRFSGTQTAGHLTREIG